MLFSPDRVDHFGAKDLTVRSNQRKPLDQRGGPDNAIRWIFGISCWKADASLQLPSWLCPTAWQDQTSAKAQHARRAKSLEMAPFTSRQRGGDHIACDRDLPAKKAENIIDLWPGRDELRHRLAMFSDHDGFVLGLNFVHDCKTICLEGTRRHLLHPETPL